MAIFTNQATLTYNNVTTNSNVATGELLEVLSATKTAVTPSYTPGSDITYVISILNSGGTALSGINISDDLGAFPFGAQNLSPLVYQAGSVRLFINGILQSTPTVTGENPLTVTGISIPAGGNAILLYEAVATEFAPLDIGAQLINTATVSFGGTAAPVQATASVSPASAPNLTITKTISPAVVTENSRVTYTFIIQNFGNTAALGTDNVAVTDTFLPILSDLTVQLDGAALTAGSTYSYNQSTGLFATVPGVITVPAASFTQNSTTGAWEITPGAATLTVTGTI
ncbi:MAG: hypothetical protein IKD31_05600 [Clostridia bacterium]|nr:hypothetical protein [Clostridia bacterium]